jgi:type II secretory pathway pseudopilin PulG
MELLVVLLIIGIMSTVALRTIDATRNRSLFDQTTAEMNKLVQAMVGNPDLAYDGRRVDFGYYGDMEELPESLQYLVRNPGSTAWRGPYFKLMSAGDLVSYLNDGWGNRYTYNPTLATIMSGGTGNFPMTVKIVDDTAQLHDNVISGSFLDADGNPPGVAASSDTVRLVYNNPAAHGGTQYAKVNPARGGYYEIALHPSDPIWPSWGVPIGTKRLQAIVPGETLTRYVTVAPRSHVVADFKFTKAFAGRLEMVGQPKAAPQGEWFMIQVMNTGLDSVTVDSFNFLSTSAPLYMRNFLIDGVTGFGFPIIVPNPGKGPGDMVRFQPALTIAPDKSQVVELYFDDFHASQQGAPPQADVRGDTFRFRFSDGSKITVSP